jgi:hypothetical protein
MLRPQNFLKDHSISEVEVYFTSSEFQVLGRSLTNWQEALSSPDTTAQRLRVEIRTNSISTTLQSLHQLNFSDVDWTYRRTMTACDSQRLELLGYIYSDKLQPQGLLGQQGIEESLRARLESKAACTGFLSSSSDIGDRSVCRPRGAPSRRLQFLKGRHVRDWATYLPLLNPVHFGAQEFEAGMICLVAEEENLRRSAS